VGKFNGNDAIRRARARRRAVGRPRWHGHLAQVWGSSNLGPASFARPRRPPSIMRCALPDAAVTFTLAEGGRTRLGWWPQFNHGLPKIFSALCFLLMAGWRSSLAVPANCAVRWPRVWPARARRSSWSGWPGAMRRMRRRGSPRLPRPAARAVPLADATDLTQLQALLAAVLKRSGRVDIVINGAGINSSTPYLEITEEEFERIVRVNLKSIFLGCQVFGKYLVERGQGGSIINMGSMSGITPLSRVFTYSLTKAAVHNLSKNLAREWAPNNVPGERARPRLFPGGAEPQGAYTRPGGQHHGAHPDEAFRGVARTDRRDPPDGQRRRLLHHWSGNRGRRRLPRDDDLATARLPGP